MNGSELYVATNEIVKDTISKTLFWQMLNSMKNKRERKMYFLRKVDSSKTASVGDTYLTAKALATDLRTIRRVNVGDRNNPYLQVPFEERLTWKDTPNRYYVDWAGGNFYLCGSVGTSQTIHMFYQRKTTDFADSNEGTEILLWPSDFHLLLAFDVAPMFSGAIDNDDINRLLTPEQRRVRDEMEEDLMDWDHDLKLSAQGDRRGYADDDQNYETPLELMTGN